MEWGEKRCSENKIFVARILGSNEEYGSRKEEETRKNEEQDEVSWLLSLSNIITYNLAEEYLKTSCSWGSLVVNAKRKARPFFLWSVQQDAQPLPQPILQTHTEKKN